MASIVVGTLRALLTMDSAKFEAGIRQAQKDLKSFSNEAKKIGASATALGTSLTKTLTLPLAGLGIGVSKLAIDFESSFAGVRKTINATEPEFQAMAKAFRDLSKTIPVNVNDLNRLGEAAGALGIPKGDVVEFARVMAELGVTTNLTADQAADSIARIQNIFGAAGKDTENLASTIVALGNAGASTESEITEMAQRIAGAGHAIGLTQANVVGFASALASVGINAEAGGSAISRVFLKMNDAVAKGGQSLAEFASVAGMSSAAFKKAFETDAAGATVALIEGLNRLKASGANVNQVIESLVGKNIILKDTLLRVSGAGALLTDQLGVANKAWRENSALSIEAGKRFETTSSQMTLLWNRIKDVGITLGNAFLPLIRDAIKAFDAMIPVIEKVAMFFASLPTPIQGAIVGFGLLVAALGPVIFIAGQLISSWGLVAGAFTATGVATKALTFAMGPLGIALGQVAIAVASVTAVVVAGYQAWMLYSESSARAAAAGRQQTTDAANLVRMNQALGTSYTNLADAVAEFNKRRAANPPATIPSPSGGPAKARAAAGGIPPEFAGIMEGAKKARKHVDEFEDSIKKLQDRLSGKDLIDATNQMVIAIERIGGVGVLTHDELTQFTGDVAKAVEKMKLLGQVVPESWQAIANTIERNKGLIETQAKLGESLSKGLFRGQMVIKAEDLIDATTLMNAVPQLVANEGVSRAFHDAATGLGGRFKAGFSTAMAGLPDVIQRAFQGGGNVAKSIGALFGNDLGTSILGDAGKGLSGFFTKNFGSKFGGALGSLIPGLGTILGGQLGEFMMKGLSKLGGWVKGLFGGPSKTELEGRDAAAAFRDQLAAGMTAADQAEVNANVAAGANREWAESAVAIKNAYIAAGKSGEEALAALDRLWKAEKQGGGAVQAVIEEITGVMNSGMTPATDDATDGVGSLTDATKGLNVAVTGSDEAVAALGRTQETVTANMLAGFDRLIAKLQDVISALSGVKAMSDEVAASAPESGPAMPSGIMANIQDNPFNDGAVIGQALEGFAGGSGGFRDFGRGTFAQLHGREEIVTQAKGASIAEMVGNALAAVTGGGGGSGAVLNLAPGAIVVQGAGKNADQIAMEIAPKILDVIARFNAGGSRTTFHKMVQAVPATR